MEPSLRILLVEDNEDDYELTKGLLPSDNIELVWAQSLASALTLIEEQSFSAILLDLGVPDSQGLATFDKIAQVLEHIPVIVVLTGNDDEGIAMEAVHRGAQDYLIKGQVTTDSLMRSLRYAIERHKAEFQLRRSNEELVSLNHALIAARDAALDASSFKSEFLANMSHDIRTPLSGIVSIAELLCLENCSVQVGEMHSHLYQSSKRLVATVDDLLDLSKLEAGRMVLNTVDCDVRDLIRDVLLVVEPTAKRKCISIAQDISESVPPLIPIDETRLKQILLNFAHNAVKFTNSGSVCLRAGCELGATGKCLRVCVTDTGIGIPKESTRCIFDPFVQADGSMSRRYGGTGLGLAISKKSAELLGGEIGVESEQGKGSTFWVTVPLGAING